MTRSMTCDPPSKKISKYIHRLELVFRDAQHHLNVGKCFSKRHSQVQSLITDQDDYQNVPIDISYRRRRMLELQDELDSEYEQVLTGTIHFHEFHGQQSVRPIRSYSPQTVRRQQVSFVTIGVEFNMSFMVILSFRNERSFPIQGKS